MGVGFSTASSRSRRVRAAEIDVLRRPFTREAARVTRRPRHSRDLLLVFIVCGSVVRRGAGTSVANPTASRQKPAQSPSACLDPRSRAGAGPHISRHTARTLGSSVQPLTDFGSRGRRKADGSAWLLVPLFGIRSSDRPAVRGARHGFGETAGQTMPVLVVGACCRIGQIVGRCGMIDLYTMRYELLRAWRRWIEWMVFGVGIADALWHGALLAAVLGIPS